MPPIGVLAPAVGGVFLLSGLIARLPALAVLVAAVGVATAAPTARLLRLAAARHTRHGPGRGAGLLGLGALTGALTALTLPFVVPADRPYAALGGLLASATAYVLGLLRLPGTAPAPAGRLRHALDGTGVAVCLFFAGWLLVPADVGGRPVAGCALLVACGAVAISVLAPLRTDRYRRPAVLCGTGAGLGVVGLAGLTAVLAAGAPEPALFAVALPLVGAPTLAWTGARQVAATSPVGTTDAPGAFAGYLLLPVPLGLVAAVVAYHAIVVGGFDVTAVALGAAFCGALAVRETVAAIDIRRYAHRLASREAHFRSLVVGSSDVTVVVDPELVVRWQSPTAARQFGLSDQDVVGRTVVDLVHPDDAAAVTERLHAVLAGEPVAAGRPVLVEARLRDGFGQWRDTESTVSDQRATPEVGALVVHVRDVGERKQLERTLHGLAFTDQLTGLPNRRDLLRSVATLRGVPGRTGAVLVLDLDGVTGAGAGRGRAASDAVPIEAANRLRAGIGPDDVAARLAGNEFAVVTPDRPIEAYGLGMRLLAALARPYELPGVTVHLSPAIGLAEVTRQESVEEILYRADAACRRAGQLGSGRVEWYDASLEAQLLRRGTLEQSLPGAAGRGELDLLYQPIMDLSDGRPVGVEALLRWRHPSLGTVLPAELVPVAEQLGVIGEVGTWVVDTACRQLAAWRRDGLGVWVSINVSARQLATHDLLAGLMSAVNGYGVPADRLTVEIAEPAVGTDLSTVVTQLAGLRALGVRTAVDHFGAGQTSLAYLRRLPVDLLKIDSALFVEPAGRSGHAGPGPTAPLIDVVVSLGRRLGMEIVAEGLEQEPQLELVRGAGCRYGQGYLFGRPAPAEHVEAYLENYRAP